MSPAGRKHRRVQGHVSKEIFERLVRWRCILMQSGELGLRVALYHSKEYKSETKRI